MKPTSIIGVLMLFLAFSPFAVAMQGHGGGPSGHDPGGHGTTPHHGGGTYLHEAEAEGVRAEFQVMRLESMNMKDPEGNTHHIMVKAFAEGTDEPIQNLVGRVKVIGPSKQETVADLKDYGGIYAANFKVEEPGRYGVICLLKVGEKKPVYKFWYAP